MTRNAKLLAMARKGLYAIACSRCPGCYGPSIAQRTLGKMAKFKALTRPQEDRSHGTKA